MWTDWTELNRKKLHPAYLSIWALLRYFLRKAHGYSRAVKEHGPPPVTSRRELMLWLCTVSTSEQFRASHFASQFSLKLFKGLSMSQHVSACLSTCHSAVWTEAENRCLKAAGAEMESAMHLDSKQPTFWFDTGASQYHSASRLMHGGVMVLEP